MHVSVIEVIMMALAVGQLIYAALTYHKDRAESRDPRRRPVYLIASMMVLTWIAVGYDIYSRPVTATAIFLSYGVDGPTQFHGIARIFDWEEYRNQKAILITRTVYSDRDRLNDDWIAKSIPYTIEGPIVTMVVITDKQMHFTAGVTNYVEYNLAVVPADIVPAQLRNLGDVARLGGKILAVSVQGIPVALPSQESVSQAH